MLRSLLATVLLAPAFSICAVHAAFPEATPRTPANLTLEQYFHKQTVEIEKSGSLEEFQTAEQWNAARTEQRRQLAEMLGLDPMPARTPLNPVITGEVMGEGFMVEKLHFQSMPGLYVTGNLYRPEKVGQPCPRSCMCAGTRMS